MNNRSENFVFGSFRTDLGLFIGTCVIAFVVAFVAPDYMTSNLFLLLLISFFDLPHVVCGLYFMLTNSKDKPLLRSKVVAIFCMALALCIGFTYLYETELLIVGFAHLSVWHFIRQHQAWFKLASRDKKTQTKIFQMGNTITSYAATWLLVMASLCGEDQFGWFGVNDLFLFPIELRSIFLGIVIGSLIFYLIMHSLFFIKNKTIMISQHLVLASMLLVWYFSRYSSNLYLRPALIFIPHSLVYFFLLFKSTKVEKRFNFKIIALILTIFFGILQFYIITKVPERSHDGLDGLSLVISFVLALSITHAFSDRLFWNSKDNPGWAFPLRK